MPSPFPGMDPFIEMQEWDDFHPNFATEIQAQLAPQVEPKYVVRVERRVYFERAVPDDEDLASPSQRIPDVAVLKTEEGSARQSSTATATLDNPQQCLVPQGEERHEFFLVIRGAQSHEVITVLEVLSPTNKRAGADGRELYLEKRTEVLDGLSHFVELDLLRGGRRMPIRPNVPLGRKYYALVSRCGRRPRGDLYTWTLREPMPCIRIPLEQGDPDVPLDLQKTFSNVYQRTRYDLSIDYGAPVSPPPTEEEQQWLREILGSSE